MLGVLEELVLMARAVIRHLGLHKTVVDVCLIPCKEYVSAIVLCPWLWKRDVMDCCVRCYWPIDHVLLTLNEWLFGDHFIYFVLELQRSEKGM